MNLETVIQGEVSLKDKNKYIISLTCEIYTILLKWYRGTYLQSRNTDTDIENKCIESKGGRSVGMNEEFGTDTFTLLIYV